jgi:hypothetical protein
MPNALIKVKLLIHTSTCDSGMTSHNRGLEAWLTTPEIPKTLEVAIVGWKPEFGPTFGLPPTANGRWRLASDWLGERGAVEPVGQRELTPGGGRPRRPSGNVRQLEPYRRIPLPTRCTETTGLTPLTTVF